MKYALRVLRSHCGPMQKHNVGVILGNSEGVLCDYNFGVIDINDFDRHGFVATAEYVSHSKRSQHVTYDPL